MAATITHRVTTTDTGNTPNASAAFSFASGDLLVVFVTKEASATSAPGMASADLTVASVTGVSSFTLISLQGFNSDVDCFAAFVANQKTTGAGAAGVVTIGSGADAGAGSIISVYTVAGLHASALGSAAVKQSGVLANQAGGGVPSINFATGAVDTNNAVIGAIGVGDGTPSLTAPSGWSEGSDTGYTTGKAQGIETVFRNSGHTNQTVAWQTEVTGGSWAGIILELNTVLSRTEKPSGIITPSGTRTESKSHTSKPTGTITLTGTVSESHTVSGPSNTDRRSGTVDLQGGIALRTNLVPNPSFETNATGWNENKDPATTTNDFARSSAWSYVGSYSMHCKWTATGAGQFGNIRSDLIDIPLGVVCAYQVRVNLISRGTAGGEANCQVTPQFWDSVGGFIGNGTSVNVPLGESLVTVVDGHAAAEQITLTVGSVNNGITTGEVLEFYIDAVMVEQASVVGTYLEGSVPQENLTHTSKPTGTIVLQGTRVESHSVSDRPSGTVTLTGTRRESKSETFKTTGTVVLQGTRTESHALSFADRRSGTVSLAGTRQESFTHVSKPTGTIQLSGTVSEQNLGPTIDRPTGTIALTGTRRESLSRTEQQTGTVVLSGQIDETFAGSITDSVSGTILLTGTRQESNSRTVEVSGQISITGTVSESYQVSGGTETHSVSGTITLSGTRRESKTYTDKTTGQILVSGTLSESLSTSFTDTPTGVIVLSGTRQESNDRTVLCDGIIVLSGQVYEVYLPAGLTIDRRSGTIRLTGAVRELHSRWDNLGGERWPADTDSRWPGDTGERWDHDSDSRWGTDTPERWEVDPVA